jgi:hypothetical protein
VKAALLLALLAGCYAPRFAECNLACGVGDSCPDGYDCLGDGFCHTPGAALCGAADASVTPDGPTSEADACVPVDFEVACDGADDDCDEQIDEGCWSTGTPSPILDIMQFEVGQYNSPRLSADGLRLYFAQSGRVWMSTRASEDSRFGLPAEVNGVGFAELTIAAIDLTPDETTLILDAVPMGLAVRDLYMATRQEIGKEFTSLVPLSTVNDAATDDRHPFLARDRSELVFASTRSGVVRLYRSVLRGDLFQPPELLDVPLEAGDEQSVLSPSLSDDGMTLFFARVPTSGEVHAAVATRTAPGALTFRPARDLPFDFGIGLFSTLYVFVSERTNEVFFASDRPWSPAGLRTIWRAQLCRAPGCVPDPVIPCDDGIRSEDGRSCYSFRGIGTTYAAAQTVCEQTGAGVATVHSNAELATVVSLVPEATYVWLGATDTTAECNTTLPGCRFQWTTGEPWIYAPWAEAQPDDLGGAEDCVLLFTNSIYDFTCESTVPQVLCERRLSPW